MDDLYGDTAGMGSGGQTEVLAVLQRIVEKLDDTHKPKSKHKIKGKGKGKHGTKKLKRRVKIVEAQNERLLAEQDQNKRQHDEIVYTMRVMAQTMQQGHVLPQQASQKQWWQEAIVRSAPNLVNLATAAINNKKQQTANALPAQTMLMLPDNKRRVGK